MMRTVMASPASPFAISEASSIGIPKAAAAVPVGWRGNAWGNAWGNAVVPVQYYSTTVRGNAWGNAGEILPVL